ncbi:hypothetical protein DFQ01_108201 [Paenibacillus cellulosilyticus]|uniref:Uncharacterized protein n=1 Tax=Paenibacillus cellulosilyticus TaxID=375489 RepID=A0A2V2YV61_9BACL|nr:hypothetical protein [Paenibacillus cellulosilyticus]PWW02922.1 hypothetical protein DFQ01_108201 [Paenibacillus cellulosilyticus]QKS45830.1 hypothetical protein HUB94_16320 [Paenibacillus cellulosilyticus]
MNNKLIFEQYDMVVSITEKTLNDQLTHLLQMGIIQPEFIVLKTYDRPSKKYVFQVLASSDEIPRNPDGTPKQSCIDGVIHPQVTIARSGTDIVFELNFLSGTAYLWDGAGPEAQLVAYDMTDWKYGISITMDLKSVEKESLTNNRSVPDLVKDQLYHFMDHMFTVNSLFMDFESTDLLRFDPTHTDTGKDAGDLGCEQFVLFMQAYLRELQAKGNPYILGYAIHTTPLTDPPSQLQVPDALQPVGTTFTMFHDADNSNMSTLNFILATKGGHRSVEGTPGIFDTNWIGTTEQCDAKMIYSHHVLVEEFLLRPIFDQMSSGIYGHILNHIHVGMGNPYEDAKRAYVNPDGTYGFSYNISDVNSGDNQYVNRFSVNIANNTAASKIDLNFNGHIALYRNVSRDMGFCTAHAWAQGSVDWSGTISLIASVADNRPVLSMTNSFKIDQSSSNSGKNDCAKAFEIFGEIVKGILDVLTFFSAGDFFHDLFDQVFKLDIPGIGDIGNVFGNLSNVCQTTIMLPAGQVFFFKNPSADNEGNFMLELTYKAEN